MKILEIILILLFLTSCNKEEASIPVATDVGTSKKTYDFNANSNSLEEKDDFKDLEKKEDEACDTEEEITKKLSNPKQEVFQLQGGDTGCDVSDQS